LQLQLVHKTTARNLFWAIDRMEDVAAKGKNIEEIKTALLKEARKSTTKKLKPLSN